MADSIERIADEMAACIDHGNGSLTVNSSRVIDWLDRLRALSPAGGDRAESLEAIMLEHADGLAAAAAALKAAIATSSQQDRPDSAFGPECSICQADMLHEGPCDFINVDALAASPQQEPGPAINSSETYSKPIADPSGQTLAGACGDAGHNELRKLAEELYNEDCNTGKPGPKSPPFGALHEDRRNAYLRKAQAKLDAARRAREVGNG